MNLRKNKTIFLILLLLVAISTTTTTTRLSRRKVNKVVSEASSSAGENVITVAEIASKCYAGFITLIPGSYCFRDLTSIPPPCTEKKGYEYNSSLNLCVQKCKAPASLTHGKCCDSKSCHFLRSSSPSQCPGSWWQGRCILNCPSSSHQCNYDICAFNVACPLETQGGISAEDFNNVNSTIKTLVNLGTNSPDESLIPAINLLSNYFKGIDYHTYKNTLLNFISEGPGRDILKYKLSVSSYASQKLTNIPSNTVKAVCNKVTTTLMDQANQTLTNLAHTTASDFSKEQDSLDLQFFDTPMKDSAALSQCGQGYDSAECINAVLDAIAWVDATRMVILAGLTNNQVCPFS